MNLNKVSTLPNEKSMFATLTIDFYWFDWINLSDKYFIVFS